MAKFCIKWAVLASVRFFSYVPPPPSDFVPVGDQRGPKILSHPIKNLEKKPWKHVFVKANDYIHFLDQITKVRHLLEQFFGL